MAATATFLAALARAPEQGFMVLAGMTEVNIRDELRSVHYYHRVKVPADFKYKPGQPLLVRCDVQPNRKNDGRVNLIPVQIQAAGTLATKHDDRGNFVLLDGFNLAQAQGRLAQNPQLQTFEDGQAVINFSLIVGHDHGLLECTAYGQTATLLSQLEKNNEVLVFGRLVNEKRQSAQGLRTYTRLELWRQSILG